MSERKFFVILQTQISGLEEMMKARGEHLSYLRVLHESGEVFAAGRFADGSGGMIILHVASKERAEEIASRDPYVLKKIRSYQVRPWERSL